jgi:hypothetical protein
MHSQPVVHQINTWVWLAELSDQAGRHLTLADVPGSAWDEVLLPGVDTVWLMGVWERSPAGREIARAHQGLQTGYRRALPDLRSDDVVGSPYSVHRYRVDAHLGGDEALAAARSALAARGVRLLLDYVPNHVAIDHPWVRSHPEWFVTGDPEDAADDPDAFVEVDGVAIALGKDPYFPAWTDVAQLNAFSAGLRAATAETLSRIAEQADGVRCDMAMLMLNDVFARTWGPRAGPSPGSEFWADVIKAVHAGHPTFAFVAEVYWGLEPTLLEQGFAACYDKPLYDRLVRRDAPGVVAHLRADPAAQRRTVRFLENHDEPRAAAAFPQAAWPALAVVLLTLPGWVLLHEGQADGRRVRPPVQLGRRPAEPRDPDLRALYDRLTGYVHKTGLRAGDWELLEVAPAGDTTAQSLAAWTWVAADQRHLVVVNLGDQRARGRLAGLWGARDGTVTLTDVLSGEDYPRAGEELVAEGLFVELAPWGYHLLRC